MSNMLFFPNECSVCKSTDFPKPCSRCYLILYCGSAHQVKDWPIHKDFCDVIWSIVREQRVSHIYEKLCGADLDTWIKERKRMCSIVRSKLNRPLFLQEEQMLLFPRSCFVCYNTKQDLLTTCPICLCANFCTEHPFSSQHDKDCLSLKLFYEFNGKMQDPAKLKTVLTLINEIAETTKFYNSSDIPQSMIEYLNQQIKGENHMFEKACASNLLSMSLTIFNALKKLNLQSVSTILLHVRCDVTDSSIWELLFHFLPNLTVLNIVFIEQRKTQKLKVDLCDGCCSKYKKMTLETNELLYKNYVKSKIYKKPDIFAYLNTEISKNVDENLEWDFLLENLSRIGSPLVLTSVTEKMAKMVSESLRSTFWPSLISYEGPNDFGALDPLREWTDGGVSKINQHLIITEGRIQCKASTFYSGSFLSKKRRENSTSPLIFFHSNVCQVCRSNDISIFCKFCSMIFYCSEPHRQEDWSKHKDICQVIQRLLKKTGMKNIFDGEIDLMGGQKTDPESWLQVKLRLLSKAESEFGRKLWVFQQQMILFPKTCFVCHETEVIKLKTCECGISLCRKHDDSPIHKEICKDFQLSWQLLEKEKLPDSLPKHKYVSDVKEKLPASIEEFMNLHLTLENETIAEETPHFNRIVIAELLTKPLTLLHAIKKLNIPEFKNDNDSENNSKIVVHVIGSKNSENVSYEFWDIFFNWLPNLETLSITFVGPEAMTLNLNRTFHESKERNLSLKSYPADYEQFVQSPCFVKPDIIVGFNLDIHECVNDICSCKETILNIQKLNVPFVMTSGTKERAEKDHERLSKVLGRSIKYDICDPNPFASLVPERDFETEGLRYSNKYLLIYCELDQMPDAFQNSKLRKLLLERQEAERLADTSHLSDLEKTLRTFKIEGIPFSTENAESKTKGLNPKNSFLFEAAKYELKYMLRNFKGKSKSVSCTKSEFEIDPFKSVLGSNKEKPSEENLLSSTKPSECKSESGSADKDLKLGKEKSLLKLNLTHDSEPKSEFGFAKNKILEDSFSSSIEDSKCLAENGPATQLLFKENLLFTTEDFEDVQESGSEHIWNEIFNDNTLAVSEDSVPELKSGYANVKICTQSESAKEEISEKNLSTSEQDLELTSESLEYSIIKDSECTIKSKSPNDKLFKDPSIEDSPPKLEIGSAHFEIFSITESSKSESGFDEYDISKKNVCPIAEEDVECKSESEISDGGTSMKHLWLSSEDSESETTKNKILEDFASDVEYEFAMEDSFKKNVLFTDKQGLEIKTEIANSESLKEDVLLLTENSESKFGKDQISKKNLSEIVNGKTSMDKVWPVTDDSKSKPDSEVSKCSSESLFRRKEIFLKKLMSFKSNISKSESASANVETLEKDLNPTTEVAESKSESGFTKSETIMEDSLLITKNSKSESRSLQGEILKENLLFSSEDSESKCEEYESTKNEIFKENLLSDLECGAETRTSNDKLFNENLLPKTDDFESKLESRFADSERLLSTTDDSENKLESGSIDNLITERPLIKSSATEDLECESETEPAKEIEAESAAANAGTLKENLLTTIENTESKPESEAEVFDSKLESRFANSERLLATNEESENKLEPGSIDNLITEKPLIKSSATEDSECESETEPAKEIEAESETANGETLKENLLITVENTESKLESGSEVSVPKLESRSVDSEGLLGTNEESENKLELGSIDNLITERPLIESSTTEDSECESEIEPAKEIEAESETANGETLKENLLITVENTESKLESGSEVSVPKLESRSVDSEGLLGTNEESENKLESGSIDNLITERPLIESSATEDSECESETERAKEIEAESAAANAGTLKENLLITVENIGSKLESGSEVSTSKLESRSADSERLLATNEDSENKLEPGSIDNLITERPLIESFTTEDSECESEIEPAKEIEAESETANGETLKENLLITFENTESKLESGSEVSVPELESRSIDSEGLLGTNEESERKLEPGSIDNLITERPLMKSSATEDSECESETKRAKEIEAESTAANDGTLKENLLITVENTESKLESGSEVSAPKLESRSTHSERLLATDEESENKLEPGSIDNLITERLLIKSSATEDSECESETERANEIEAESAATNAGTLKENLLTTIENTESKSESEAEVSESKIESGSAEDFGKENVILISSSIENSEYQVETAPFNVEVFQENLLSITEDFESKSASVSSIVETLKRESSQKNLLTTNENSEPKSDPGSDKDEILKEISLSTTENSESKPESEAEVSESKVESGSAEDFVKEDVILISSSIENSEYKEETAPFNDEVFQENLLSMTEDFESKSVSLSSIVETLKGESSQKNLLPTYEKSEPKSDLGSDNDEILKEIPLSTTEDSESKSESGPTNEELLRENLLLKEEIQRLKENEKLIKTENSFLKEEICRLQEEKTSI